MRSSDLEALRHQAAARFGRVPETVEEQADALALCEPALVSRVAAANEIKKALANPRVDFWTFGGLRATPGTDEPASNTATADDDLLDRAALALAEVGARVRKISEDSVAAARRDLSTGGFGPLAKRRHRVTAADLADQFDDLASMLR